jgi:hypothetical protein
MHRHRRVPSTIGSSEHAKNIADVIGVLEPETSGGNRTAQRLGTSAEEGSEDSSPGSTCPLAGQNLSNEIHSDEICDASITVIRDPPIPQSIPFPRSPTMQMDN